MTEVPHKQYLIELLEMAPRGWRALARRQDGCKITTITGDFESIATGGKSGHSPADAIASAKEMIDGLRYQDVRYARREIISLSPASPSSAHDTALIRSCPPRDLCRVSFAFFKQDDDARGEFLRARVFPVPYMGEV